MPDGSVAGAERYLCEAAEKVKAQLDSGMHGQDTAHASWRVLQEPEVAPAIVLFAERGPDLYHPFDLVALSTHGAGGWERWVLGSVTEQLLWGTPLPVLVVRPPSVSRP
jgi:nucleotide-binding universal stress UspA family protein